MIKVINKNIKSAFILGSTSTVAKSVAIELAKQGCKRFHLLARNLEKNKALKKELNDKFKVVITEEKINLNIYDSYSEVFDMPEVDDFDLYLITIGNLGNSELANNDLRESLEIVNSNFTGLIPWLTSIVSDERILNNSRLWVFSSVAGDRGRPSNYHYGASKSALTIFCEGLLLKCFDKPFKIRIIKAGYMQSPMTFGKAPKILCIKTSVVAKLLMRSPNKRGIEYLPFWWGLVMKLVTILPAKIAAKL